MTGFTGSTGSRSQNAPAIDYSKCPILFILSILSNFRSFCCLQSSNAMLCGHALRGPQKQSGMCLFSDSVGTPLPARQIFILSCAQSVVGPPCFQSELGRATTQHQRGGMSQPRAARTWRASPGTTDREHSPSPERAAGPLFQRPTVSPCRPFMANWDSVFLPRAGALGWVLAPFQGCLIPHVVLTYRRR